LAEKKRLISPISFDKVKAVYNPIPGSLSKNLAVSSFSKTAFKSTLVFSIWFSKNSRVSRYRLRTAVEYSPKFKEFKNCLPFLPKRSENSSSFWMLYLCKRA